ncbi:MAG: RIP metalloprotease RseP [Candidatus Omnitrophica bacterium]|nr:RIP metalloprotease RseP [Candidatus Omnitrophota bacterium]
MFSIIAFLFVLSVLVIIHEFGHFIAAKRQGVKVEKFSFGFGPKLFGVKKGDTEYIVSLVLLGGYVKLAGDEPGLARGESFEFLSKSVWQRFKIIFFGPLLNYLLGFVLFWFIFFAGSPTATNKVGAILDGYPAKAAGLQKDDRIIAVDGKPVKYWEELTEVIHNKKEGDLVLIIERRDPFHMRGGIDKKWTHEIRVPPVRKEITDIFGKKRGISLIGIGPSDEIVSVRYGFLNSGLKAMQQVYKLTEATYKSLLFIVTGKMSMKESVTGPIGIFIITSRAASMGVIYLLQMMAVLSASLAIFNLLPLPVLDGGHILFLLIEKIRGRPLSARRQEIVAQIGLAFLISLMLFVLYTDIIRFVLKK